MNVTTPANSSTRPRAFIYWRSNSTSSVPGTPSLDPGNPSQPNYSHIGVSTPPNTGLVVVSSVAALVFGIGAVLFLARYLRQYTRSCEEHAYVHESDQLFQAWLQSNLSGDGASLDDILQDSRTFVIEARHRGINSSYVSVHGGQENDMEDWESIWTTSSRSEQHRGFDLPILPEIEIFHIAWDRLDEIMIV